MTPSLRLALVALLALPFAAAGVAAQEFASPGEIAAFGRAHISLSEAITAAEKKDPNSQVMDVAFATAGEGPHYEVTLYGGDGIEHLTVDATSGDALMAAAQTPLAEADRQTLAEVAALKGSKTTVAQTVAVAEKTHGGEAMQAGLQAHAAGVTFDVALVRDEGNIVISYDPASAIELSTNNSH